MNDQIISKEGYEKLQKEMDECLKRRREIAERIERAKELGDLSENAEYHDAKDAQAFNEGRISELMSLIKNLTVVEHEANHGSAGMGSKVTVKINGKEKQYTIVSFNEADPVEGKISNESPLGSSFIHRKRGDKVRVTTPSGEAEYEIIKVE